MTRFKKTLFDVVEGRVAGPREERVVVMVLGLVELPAIGTLLDELRDRFNRRAQIGHLILGGPLCEESSGKALENRPQLVDLSNLLDGRNSDDGTFIGMTSTIPSVASSRMASLMVARDTPVHSISSRSTRRCPGFKPHVENCLPDQVGDPGHGAGSPESDSLRAESDQSSFGLIGEIDSDCDLGTATHSVWCI